MSYSMFANKGTATKKEFLNKAIELINENLENYKKSFKVYNIIGYGRVLEGVAFYHEINQIYNCVGIEVEIESLIEFEQDGKPPLEGEIQREVGFYSIWKGKSSVYAPVTFESGIGELGNVQRFENGLGDLIDVTKEIFSVEVVNEAVQASRLLK